MAIRKPLVLVGGRKSFLPAADSLDIPFSWLSSKPTTLVGYGITDGVNKSGDTFTGPVLFGAAGVIGYSRLDPGAANTPGTLGFYTQDSIRRGYIGWASGANLLIAAENGWKYDFTGLAPTINGSAIHTAATFDPATKLGVSAKAADSELLDGIDSSQIVYGSNANKMNEATLAANFNTAAPNGFYEASAALNVPVAGWNWAINVRHSNTGNQYGFQLSNPIGTNELYIRGVDAGVWRPWDKIWHAGNSARVIVQATDPGAVPDGTIWLW